MEKTIGFCLEDIIEEYADYVYKIVINTSSGSLSHEDVEEVVSDTFYLFWLHQADINKNIKSYLGSIARNTTYNRLKYVRTSVELDLDRVGCETDYLEILAIKEKLAVLNEEDKLIFDLYYVEGLAIKEISRTMKISTANAKVRLYRLRKKLREDVKK